jgi:hypothetical protein
MGVAHGGIIVDTLPLILNHSLLPLKIHMGGIVSFPFNVGWNDKWNRDMFCSSDESTITMNHIFIYGTLTN